MTSVAAGSTAYLFNDALNTNSTVSTTLSNIENITLTGNGINYVVGSAGANVITGGTGVDYITGGLGADTIQGNASADVINLTEATQSIDTVIFTTNATTDTVSGFITGAGGDLLQDSIAGIAVFNGANAAVAAGATVSFLNYTVGAATVNAGAATNFMYVTNTAGLNDVAGLNTALAANNVTFTAFTANQKMLGSFYDADDARMTLFTYSDASANQFDGVGSTVAIVAQFSMTAAQYQALATSNIGFIA